MTLAHGLAAAVVAALGLALVPGADWAFQFVYPLMLALGAASLRWWPALIVLVLPLWAALDYAIEPSEALDVDDPLGAAVVALLLVVPISLAAFALGKGVRAFALALGARNRPSP
ncbi:MAG: hypothetical protein MSC30_01690 [Gaiellaceae bacterium MAG52_C11]|nr:hypothetical protein [Candidatus Gaiellasilicea maunaloa]